MSVRQNMLIMSWENLAAAVRARRGELGLTQADVAEDGQVSVDTVNNIENLRRTPKGGLNRRSARGLEAGLQWAPGSVESVLSGGVATPVAKARRRGDRALDEGADTPATAKPDSNNGLRSPEPNDRFALARQVISLRSTLSTHQSSMSSDAREALMAEMAKSAHEAEESIARMMPWLDDEDRGEAIGLLVKLREPLA